MKHRLPTLDVFSGIGGFAYALRPIARTIAYCENDQECRRLLSKNMKANRLDTATIFDDVASLTGSRLNTLPVLMTAGFPCTDISSMNPHGKGIRGARSGLVHHVFRLLDETPSIEYLFLENSNWIMTRGFAALSESLRERNFILTYGIFSANEAGAPHLRKRWWCLAFKPYAKSLPMLKCRHLISKFNDWSIEPVPRVIPRISHDVYKETVRRGKVLGNSVVPMTVAFAYNQLVSISNLMNDMSIMRKSL